MKASLGMKFVLAFGLVCWFAVLALAVSYVAEAPAAPDRVGGWMVIVLFGGVGLCILPAVAGFFWRGGEQVSIDEEHGLTNFKDRLGPIAWHEIRGASVRSIGRVRYLGKRRVLFVEVDAAVAERHLRTAGWLVRLSPRRRTPTGRVELGIMGYPPYNDDELNRALAKILAHSGTRARSDRHPTG